jgi:two-component system chemotaxis response regulator CheB
VRHHDIIAVGASAGGIRAIRSLVKHLPPDLPAAVLAVVHVSPEAEEGVLRRSLESAGGLPVAFAREGDKVEHGRLYIAPPDRHLLVDGERLLVRRGPIENGSRPAIDPLFRSVACSFRGRAIGVVLTGYLDDGVSGLIAIKRCGGLAVVQDPEDAEYPEMPRNGVDRAKPHHVVPLDQMAALLRELTGTPAGSMARPPRDLELEVRIAAEHEIGIGLTEQLGEPSPFACPECHGSLREVRDHDRVRYRCHTGHAYSLDSLGLSQGQELERALSSALRALEERAHLLQRMSRDSNGGDRNRIARQFERRAREYEAQAAFIRNILTGREQPANGAV